MTSKMRTIRFHEHGEPQEVLRLEECYVPEPQAGHVVVRVVACGLNPADWSLCRGFSAKKLPAGIGLDVSGIVVAVGEGVTDTAPGDAVFGPSDFSNYCSAGASEFAALYHWERLPEALSHVDAAALPMVVETAARYVDWSGLVEGQTVLVNGGGTMVGYAAVQMAIRKGANVCTTAGSTFGERLRAMGAMVVAHGEGLPGRVRQAICNTPDVVIDVAPVNLKSGTVSALPDLIEIVGDPKRVITITDFEGASKTGVRTGAENVVAEGGFKLRWDVLGEYGRLAAEGQFSIPVARTFRLENWLEALDISLEGNARGKLLLLPVHA